MDAVSSSNVTVVTSQRKYPPTFCRCMPFAWIVGIITRTHHPITYIYYTSAKKSNPRALASFSVFGHLLCACTNQPCCPLLLQLSKAIHPCWDHPTCSLLNLTCWALVIKFQNIWKPKAERFYILLLLVRVIYLIVQGKRSTKIVRKINYINSKITK